MYLFTERSGGPRSVYRDSVGGKRFEGLLFPIKTYTILVDFTCLFFFLLKSLFFLYTTVISFASAAVGTYLFVNFFVIVNRLNYTPSPWFPKTKYYIFIKKNK